MTWSAKRSLSQALTGKGLFIVGGAGGALLGRVAPAATSLAQPSENAQHVVTTLGTVRSSMSSVPSRLVSAHTASERSKVGACLLPGRTCLNT